jgi:hypothetical protein
VVVVVGLLAYPLSFGPACWLVDRGFLKRSVIAPAYGPMLWNDAHGPACVSASVTRYVQCGMKAGGGLYFWLDDRCVIY